MSTEKMKAKITIHVNGRKHTVNVDPSMPLLYVLRNYLELNGPKYGCGQELCGSCMVLIDNKALPSCRLPVDTLQNKAITTLEGLVRKDGKLHPVQQAFVDQQAAQCGYCLNGMVISAAALLEENKSPDEEAIRTHLQRVLCRCGSHSRVIKAVKQAAQPISPKDKQTQE
ncbi:(2Fe-2S)-binding protein [Rhodocytophaga aerolata]|uniref:(2Fe-2S)-binding protein n=1 Tax=Rhodocytophaga aerolata TaxID=455078 RepID=A0ABT8REB1_9BACT|nr:(2Fe-2S)-binding protein [Rhodocytophaga aerolata]MDO1450449.1 (2Fe-2S)-binding protein [Rhodocytophaga aerolata]